MTLFLIFLKYARLVGILRSPPPAVGRGVRHRRLRSPKGVSDAPRVMPTRSEPLGWARRRRATRDGESVGWPIPDRATA